MPSLRELQQRFAGALFDGADAPIVPFVHGGGIDAAARLGIYRNNLREGFTRTLALEFPVIERLVGADYFRQLALGYLRAHPSATGNLHFVGVRFPDHLRRRFGGSEYDYLPDVAELEWAYQESMVAADAAPLAPDALRGFDPARYAELRFALHPACRLVRSAYPIVRIWSANQPDASAAETIDLGSGGDHVLVRRAAECIEFRRLPAGEFTLLRSLAHGLPLGLAYEAACCEEPGFDPGEALRRLVLHGVLVSAWLPALATNSP